MPQNRLRGRQPAFSLEVPGKAKMNSAASAAFLCGFLKIMTVS
jgi:hypothetical protein